MTDYLAEAVAERDRVKSEARALLDGAALAARDLDDDEQRSFDALMLQVDKLEERAAYLRRVDAASNLGPDVNRVARAASSLGRTDRMTDEIRQLLADGQTSAQWDYPTERRDIDGTTADFSQNDFIGKFAMYMRTLSPWMGIATIVRADNGRPAVIPTMTTDAATVTPGEGTAITDSSPVLGNVTLTPRRYKAFTTVTNEQLQDQETDLAGMLAFSFARSISLSFGAAATTLVLAGATPGTAVGTPFFDLDDLVTQFYSLAGPYRSNAAWVMSNSAIAKTAKLKTSDGAYLWSPDPAVGQPDTLLGRYVYEDPALATVGSASASVICLDGPKTLLIKASPLQFKISTEYEFQKDITAFKATIALGLVVQDPAGIRKLVSGNT